ncbi:DUF1801 domain-containing protein [Psychroflexus aestuariivivens]|uniref:DUF1801 domain-containing protein n=1 Tax=Psychroflexus aestuariivivens TaxID=1795040 RepID=UPI000FD87ABA|nr:DUF1801 domain-containing protein [Psychroflexus aestuariivivens]
MKIEAKSPKEYIAQLPEDRQEAISKLREIIKANLPEGFSEEMNYGMIGYVVPFDLYPKGYHCNSDEPLPFISIASQKNHIGFYHMGIYANQELLDWFVSEFPKYSKLKLDMGKSCIRFRNPKKIPFELIAELCQKMTPEDWIETYERQLK